jgi:sigma-B regulation protein RsbU (phosphoserine phosphatase)
MRTARILVVDDEPGMVRAIERVLGRTHQVCGSRSSREAVTLAESFDAELAILDLRMPELDGFALMAQLQARHPGLDVILMTGSVEDFDEKLIRALRGRAFYFIQKPFDHDVLKTLVDRCLELRWQREENRRHVQRLESELFAARAFQQGLLPPPEAVADGLAIRCRYVPCSEMGGDFYDYAFEPSGTTALLIADVSGHGVSAAMLTGIVKSAFRSSHADGYAPHAVVERVWRSVADFGPERFITLLAALVSPRDGWLDYVNAGHPSGFLWHTDGQTIRLDSTGPLVSPALPFLRWEQRRLPLVKGDQLLLYTDGVADALVGTDELEQQWLATMLERCHDTGALIEAVVADVQSRLGDCPQPDDLTMVTANVV